MVPELEHRVHTLESNHQSFVYELRQTNETLIKIEKAIERQNEIHTDIRLLRQEFTSHTQREEDSQKRQNERIESIETTISRLNWMIISSVVAALLALVVRGT